MRNVVHFGSGAIMRTQTYPWETGNDDAIIPKLIASWPIENQDDASSYGIAGSDLMTDSFAMQSTIQAVVLQQSGKLASIKLFVNPDGGLFDMVVQLYAAAGAASAWTPTGSILATSDVLLNASLVAGGSMQEFIFSGANQYDLLAGSAYVFVFTYAGAFPPAGENIWLGLNWASSPPNNSGVYQHQTLYPDPDASLTFYLYAL